MDRVAARTDISQYNFSVLNHLDVATDNTGLLFDMDSLPQRIRRPGKRDEMHTQENPHQFIGIYSMSFLYRRCVLKIRK